MGDAALEYHSKNKYRGKEEPEDLPWVFVSIEPLIFGGPAWTGTDNDKAGSRIIPEEVGQRLC